MAPTLGISMRDFWELTPYEFTVIANHHQDKKRSDWDEKVGLAWLTAYFQRVDKFSSKVKDEFMYDAIQKKAKGQTTMDMYEVVQRLNAQFGGNVQ
jgi:hypothetical protein